MPNYCDFEMKLTGKKENVEEFVEVLNRDYDDGPHFWRVFQADVDKTAGTDDNYIAYVTGYCAWSVHSCMCDGIGTYNNDFKNDTDNKYPLISLQSESKRLNINIEVFSREPGIGFEEHYLYKNGEERICDCVDYEVIWFDIAAYKGKDNNEKFENFLKDIKEEGVVLNRKYTLKDLNENDELVLKEMDNWGKYCI